MGKTLVIKGADFSAVAVDVVIPAPTADIELKGSGAAGDFSNDSYYISNNKNGRIWYKNLSGGNEEANLSRGAIMEFKLSEQQSCYFVFNSNEEYPRYSPYLYNLENITNFTDNSGYKIVEGVLNETPVGQSGISCMKLNLSQGDTILYNTRGGNSFYGLIVKNGSDVSVYDDRYFGSDNAVHYELMKYVAPADVTVYINTATSYLTNGSFVCKVID